MNVAVLLSGHLRCWKTVFPNFKEKIIDVYNPDIFIHTWDDEGYWVPQEGNMGIRENAPLIDLNEVIEYYNPNFITVEKFSDFEPSFAERVKYFTNYYHRPRNIVSMFYKISSVVQLMERYTTIVGKQYDMVIRLRPDMIYHENLPLFQPEIFYTLAHRNHVGTGTGDMIQVGTYEQMVQFSKIGSKLEKLYDETGLLCPHIISEHYIKNHMNVKHSEFNLNKTIQHTPNGQYRPW